MDYYGTQHVEGVKGGVYHLDGRHVTDMLGFHCAMGEAVAGPAGYVGREWNTCKDRLFGGCSAVPPFELVWHDSEVARLALADTSVTPEGRCSYFDEVVSRMRGFGGHRRSELNGSGRNSADATSATRSAGMR